MPKRSSSFDQLRDFALPISIVFAALIIGGAWVLGPNSVSTPEAGTVADAGRQPEQRGSTPVSLTVSPDDHIRGNPDAPVTIVEFSDLQCPFCRSFHPTMLQALDEYGDRVRWVYKHFPLDAIHPEATPAAEASECVWEQKGEEGFWQFADTMFEQQERLGSSFYREVAGSLGVDLAQYDDCVSSRKYRDKVAADYQQGIQSGVTGTPGSFVNGIPVRGAIPYVQLKSIIDQAL